MSAGSGCGLRLSGSSCAFRERQLLVDREADLMLGWDGRKVDGDQDDEPEYDPDGFRCCVGPNPKC